MKPLADLSIERCQSIKLVLADIDDTITTDGRLTARAYSALEQLHENGLLVIPITGRPAGWCDHIARMWPVDGVVGENGAFYFKYDRKNKVMKKRFHTPDLEREENRKRLLELQSSILERVPGCAIASDQHYREADLAIDFCEDVEALCDEDIARIVSIFNEAGATAKISSIHVNGWFGRYDKLSMTHTMLAECFDLDLETEKENILYVGDSPNDAPMFAYFPHAIGVANVTDFKGQMPHDPAYVTKNRAGAGFCEMAQRLLECRKI